MPDGRSVRVLAPPRHVRRTPPPGLRGVWRQRGQRLAAEVGGESGVAACI